MYNLGISFSSIAEFPTVEKAIAYIKSKVSDLFNKDYELRQMRDRITRLKAIAKRKNNDKAYGMLKILERQVMDSQVRQDELEKKVQKIINLLPKDLGVLPVIPVALAAIAIPTAVLLAIHYKKVAAHKQTLDLIEKGLLTPEEAKSLMPAPWISFGSIPKLLLLPVIGIGAYLFLTRKK